MDCDILISLPPCKWSCEKVMFSVISVILFRGDFLYMALASSLCTTPKFLLYGAPDPLDMFRLVYYEVLTVGKRVVGIQLKCLLVLILSTLYLKLEITLTSNGLFRQNFNETGTQTGTKLASIILHEGFYTAIWAVPVAAPILPFQFKLCLNKPFSRLHWDFNMYK